MVNISETSVPDFGAPAEIPEIPATVYQARLDKVRDRMRAALQRQHPALYARCQARRNFMIDTLGYELSDAVLPLGNIPGTYFPCLLDTGLACSHA